MNLDDYLVLSSLTMCSFGAVAFLLLMFVPAPYGRFASSPSASFYSLGFPALPSRVAWLLQEVPSFVCAAIAWYLPGGARGVSRQTVLLALYLIHYFQRSFIFPLLIKGGKPTPFGVFLMALLFCLANGTMQGAYLAHGASWGAESEGLASPRFLVGTALWALGFAINLHSDAILRGLRKGANDKTYHIPRGGAFELVSGANFFGEILEWAGFAIAAYTPLAPSLPLLAAAAATPVLGVLCAPPCAFAFFTFCNIAPRGAQHHAWYISKFGSDYPRSRRAVLPFLW
jgi:3-oxo-5-alpha-steroid 4-dehydrogenase 1